MSEAGFRDWRLAALLVLSLAAAVRWSWRRPLGAGAAPSPDIGTTNAWRLVAVFTLASYLAWLKLFAIYRYLVPLEMLSAPLIVACVLYLVPGRNVRRASLSTAARSSA